MTDAFSGSSLINMAIDIERRGIAFYDVMARSTEDAAAKDVFLHLTGMERQHIKVFQDMLAEIGGRAEKPLAGERPTYLQALLDNAVFSDDMVASELATQADSDVKALELAIGAEKDSILFYYELKNMLAEQEVLDKIISEEKWHLRQLSEIRKRLLAM